MVIVKSMSERFFDVENAYGSPDGAQTMNHCLVKAESQTLHLFLRSMVAVRFMKKKNMLLCIMRT